jgi:hypothetical protein
MILQLALPHENVSWVVTKIEDVDLPGNSVLPPTGGTVINFIELINKLRGVFKSDTKTELENVKAFSF